MFLIKVYPHIVQTCTNIHLLVFETTQIPIILYSYTSTLQKAALRLITFSAPRTPSNPIFSNLGILKFFEFVEALNILFVHQH